MKKMLVFRTVICAILLLFSVPHLKAISINPLTWGTYKAKAEIKVKVDPEALRRVDEINNQLAGMKQTIDQLPAHLRREFEPLLTQALGGMQSLLDQAEVKLLNIVEQSVNELNLVLDTNINKFSEALRSNIDRLGAVLNNVISHAATASKEVINLGADKASQVISQAVTESKTATQQLLHDAIEQLDLTTTQKITLLDQLYSKRGAEFYQALTNFTQNTLAGTDQVLARRLEQIINGGSHLNTEFMTGLHSEITYLNSISKGLIDHGAKAINLVLERNTITFFEKADSLIRIYQQGNQSTLNSASSMLSSATLGITKSIILILLCFLGYRISLASFSGRVILNRISKGVMATFLTAGVVLLTYDTPLKKIIGVGSESEYSYTSAIAQTDSFYTAYSSNPTNAIPKAKEALNVLQATLSVPEAVSLTMSEKQTLRHHLGQIAGYLETVE